MRPPIKQRSKGKVILCIDDDEGVLECETAFLEYSGYTVLMAPSGPEGLILASQNWIDIVIVDYCMPEMNGQEVALQMRRLKPQAKIIMLSGAVDVPEDVLASVDAFVAKDSLAGQLLPTIERLIAPSNLVPSPPLRSDAD